MTWWSWVTGWLGIRQKSAAERMVERAREEAELRYALVERLAEDGVSEEMAAPLAERILAQARAEAARLGQPVRDLIDDEVFACRRLNM